MLSEQMIKKCLPCLSIKIAGDCLDERCPSCGGSAADLAKALVIQPYQSIIQEPHSISSRRPIYLHSLG